jgi:hypothetical protein
VSSFVAAIAPPAPATATAAMPAIATFQFRVGFTGTLLGLDYTNRTSRT